MTQGYLLGTWPPGERWLPSAVRVQNNLLAAHVSMYRAIHELQPDSAVGLAHHMRVVDPARPRRLGDRTGAALVRWGSEAFARAICEGQPPGPLAGLRFTRRRSLTAEARGTQDFFGLNYYTRSLVQFSRRNPTPSSFPSSSPGAEVTDLGWEVYPEGLGRLLTEWSSRSGRAIVVAENGIADAADRQRPSFLVRHLAEISRALARGIDVRGYFHWSLLDNFEWADGFEPRFGLVEVDYATQERRLRDSAHLFAKIAAERSIGSETWDRHQSPLPGTRRADAEVDLAAHR